MERDEDRLLGLVGKKSTAHRNRQVYQFRPATTKGTPDTMQEIGIEDSLSSEYGIEEKALEDFIALKKESTWKIDGRPTSGPYTSLSAGEIRVLELYPGEFAGGLEGALQVVSVDFEYPERESKWKRHTCHAVSITSEKSIFYTALSYVWGPPIFDARFHLQGGHELRITRGLECALKHLRDEMESIYLWADQICINQSDSRDKEQQIPLMGSIYNHATNTVIWLGDDDDGTAKSTFQTLETVHSRLDLCENQVGPADFERLHLPGPTAREWHNVKCLLRRPWFFRLWTIQELMLSRNVYIKCGGTVAAWFDFSFWCNVLEYTGIQGWLESDTKGDESSKVDLPMQFNLGCGIVNELEKERDYLASHVEKSNILSVLVATRHAQASEPKDKVYGILGMASHHIVPTYAPNVDVRQVYTDACFHAKHVSVFAWLSCVDHGTPLRPSWVPDWSCPRVTESLGYSTKSQSLYCASGIEYNLASGRAFPFQDTLGHNRSTLALRGKFFDTIAALGSVAATASLDIDNPVKNNVALFAYANMAGQYQAYPTSDSIFDAFWKTLVANKDASGNSHAPQDYSEVFSLILDASTGKTPSLSGQAYSSRRLKGFFTLSSLRYRKPAQTLQGLRKSFRAAAQNRCFAVTEKGFFGLVPRGARLHDKVCVFDGGHVPFVVRETERGHELLGECYVHGVMQGEAMDRSVESREITLV